MSETTDCVLFSNLSSQSFFHFFDISSVFILFSSSHLFNNSLLRFSPDSFNPSFNSFNLFSCDSILFSSSNSSLLFFSSNSSLLFFSFSSSNFFSFSSSNSFIFSCK
jgi:hypothetical protein